MTRASRIQAVNDAIDQAVREHRFAAIRRLQNAFEKLCAKWGPGMQRKILGGTFSEYGTEAQLAEIETAVRVALAKD